MYTTSKELPASYPLVWPAGWVRTKDRRTSAYRVSFVKARDDAWQAAKRFGGRYAVITSDTPARLDGLPLTSFREPTDPGVTFWWLDLKKNTTYAIACDRWRSVRENYRAVGLAIDALATLQRSGANQIFERSIETFARPQLVAPVSRPTWFHTLSLPADAWPPTESCIRAAYKTLAYTHHPDRGGDTKRLQAINAAYKEALAWLAVVRGGHHGS